MVLDIDSIDYRSNPYPTFKKLREKSPVCRIKPHGYWAISRYADVQMILKNPDIFSSADVAKEPTAQGPEFLLFSRGLVGADKPDHSRLRRLLSKAFTPDTVRGLEQTIRIFCLALIKNMMNRNLIDFVQAFSMPLPIMVIAELLGIDIEKKNDFKRWANILISWRNQTLTAELKNDIHQMFCYFSQMIALRKTSPKTDLISSLILASENENIITDNEVLAFIRLLLVAGTETTTNLLSNAMLHLLPHPDYVFQLKTNHTLIPYFIEESLRYDGPVLSLSRRVKRDIEIGGITIRKDDIILPLLASANHDETKFLNPHLFDIKRNPREHLAFGDGIHYCLGSQLARLQARVAFEECLKYMVSFKRLDSEPLTYLDSFFFRGLQKLPLYITW